MTAACSLDVATRTCACGWSASDAALDKVPEFRRTRALHRAHRAHVIERHRDAAEVNPTESGPGYAPPPTSLEHYVAADSASVPRFEMPLAAILAGWDDGDRRGWQAEFDYLASEHAERLDMLTTSIQEVGIREPILLGTDHRVWDGHHRLAAAQRLGLERVPVGFAGGGVLAYLLAERDAAKAQVEAVRALSVDDIARVLMAEWERAEGAPVNASYVATFADMGRAVQAALRAALDGTSAGDDRG